MRRFRNEKPELIPRILEILKATPQDLMPLLPRAPAGCKPTSLYRAMVEDGEDMWGVTWRTAYATTHPLADNGFDLDAYEFPDPRATGIFDLGDKAFRENPGMYSVGLVW